MKPHSADPNDVAGPNLTLLIELPGIRWSAEDARQARQRVPDVNIDILTALSEHETWLSFSSREMLETDAFNDPSVLLRSALNVGAGQEPKFRARRLRRLQTIGDPAEGLHQPWHYTSQMDVPGETEDEFNRWFDEEHLPGLAAVPGTVCAARYRTDGSPRYLAGYDLDQQEVRGGPAWQAATSTPWRDRIHQEFVSPRRLMFIRLR